MSKKRYKYTFTKTTINSEEEWPDTEVTMTVETNAVCWKHPMTYFQQFLEGCGYSIPEEDKYEDY